jgi:hypothetical protein
MDFDEMRVDVDEAVLATFTSEDEFTGLAVDLMIEAGSYVTIAASATDQSKTWTRDQAAVGGNLVRLYKLFHVVLDQTCQRRGEIAMMMGRLCFETIVNIRYLAKHFSPELVRSYMEYSMRYERRLRDHVAANIAERGGEVLPIEDRMLKSIERACAAAGVDLDDVDPKARRDWGGKNTFEKARDLDLEEMYFVVFGGGNHAIHGNWQEIYGNHLDWDGAGGFTANIDWHTPRPQMLFLLSLLATDAVDDFLHMLNGTDPESESLLGLDDLRSRVAVANRAHETYLQTKVWPEI